VGLLVGLVLLVIPGLVLMIWLMLTPSVVVLENRSGVAALKRSKQLGDGSHWRNAGLFLLLNMITWVMGGVLGFVIGLVGAFLSSDPETVIPVAVSLSLGLFIPLTLIAIVLVYYDRRVRKESYDAKALAEDLAR
jgi:hypothetical protein